MLLATTSKYSFVLFDNEERILNWLNKHQYRTIGAIEYNWDFNETVPLYSDNTWQKQIGNIFMPSQEDYQNNGEYELF